MLYLCIGQFFDVGHLHEIDNKRMCVKFYYQFFDSKTFSLLFLNRNDGYLEKSCHIKYLTSPFLGKDKERDSNS